MSIKERLADILKVALRANDTAHKNIVRCLRAKAEEYLCAKNMPRDLDDDDVYVKVIQTYRKALANALGIMDKNPKAKASELAESYRFEISFCESLLPQEASEEEVLPIVKAKMSELEISDSKQIGKLVGAIIKDGHKGVSASMVKRLATQLLANKGE